MAKKISFRTKYNEYLALREKYAKMVDDPKLGEKLNPNSKTFKQEAQTYKALYKAMYNQFKARGQRPSHRDINRELAASRVFEISPKKQRAILNAFGYDYFKGVEGVKNIRTEIMKGYEGKYKDLIDKKFKEMGDYYNEYRKSHPDADSYAAKKATAKKFGFRVKEEISDGQFYGGDGDS